MRYGLEKESGTDFSGECSAVVRGRLARTGVDIAALAVLLALVGAMVFPLWQIVSFDEEEFRFIVTSTVLHARALAAGSYPFWTSEFGFGMPQPFLINFNYHPLLPLFAGDVRIAILSIYGFHLFLGGLGMWLLCRRWNTPAVVAMVCVASYLFASPTLQFLYSDFWIGMLVSWTVLPILLLAFVHLLTADTQDKKAIGAISLGLVSGLLLLNGHISVVFLYLTTVGLVALGNWRETMARIGWVGLAGLVFVLIASSKLYGFYDQITAFADGTSFHVFRRAFGWAELWGLFIKPLAPVVFSSAEELNIKDIATQLHEYNLRMGNRLISFGAPFAAVSLVALPWSLRKPVGAVALVVPFLVLGALYLFRFDFLYVVISTAQGLREPLIVLGILVAGAALGRLWARSACAKRVVVAICLAQTVAIVVGALPFWWQYASAGRADISGRPFLGNVLKSSAVIDRVKKTIGDDNGRVFLSERVEASIGSGALMGQGLSQNSLPYHGVRVVNGVFKGISYREFCPDPQLMYGAIRNTSDCRMADDSLYDIGGIRYVIQYDNERVKPGLERLADLGTYGGGRIGLYENRSVWPAASRVRRELLGYQLRRREGCGHGGLFCADFSHVLKYREPGMNLDLQRKHGQMVLTMDTSSDASTVMISELYRPGWKATAYGNDGETEAAVRVQPVLGSFIALELPAGTRKVALVYRPTGHVIVEAASLTALGVATLTLLVLSINRMWRRRCSGFPVERRAGVCLQ